MTPSMLSLLPMEKIALVHSTTEKGNSVSWITAADESERQRQIENETLTPSSWRWGPIITMPWEVELLSTESFPAFYSYSRHHSDSTKCALWDFYHISLNETIKLWTRQEWIKNFPFLLISDILDVQCLMSYIIQIQLKICIQKYNSIFILYSKLICKKKYIILI